MNDIFVINVIYLLVFLARNFAFLTLILLLLLAQSFLRPQGLGSAESGYVLSYIEHFGLCRIRSNREKESPKSRLGKSE